jgi:hypothetical protein
LSSAERASQLPSLILHEVNDEETVQALARSTLDAMEPEAIFPLLHSATGRKLLHHWIYQA